MTCQPAVEVGFFLTMAFHTESHLEILPGKSIHLLHRTVAFFTGDLLFNMALVVEQNVFGKIERFNPGRRGGCIEIPMLL